MYVFFKKRNQQRLSPDEQLHLFSSFYGHMVVKHKFNNADIIENCMSNFVNYLIFLTLVFNSQLYNIW